MANYRDDGSGSPEILGNDSGAFPVRKVDDAERLTQPPTTPVRLSPAELHDQVMFGNVTPNDDPTS